MSEGACDTIHRLERELMLERMRNERLLAALREVAAGRMREDDAAGPAHSGWLCAGRLAQIARQAITSS